MKLKVYGCRGSVALSRPGSRYGGNTSCFVVSSGEERLVLDAGSGLMALGDDLTGARFPLNICISHLHVDHIIGLGTFGPAWNPKEGVRLFTCSRDARPLDEQCCGLFVPPYWPAPLKKSGAVECVAVVPDTPFDVGVFMVTPFEAGLHPDKTLSFRVTDGNKTLVYLADAETSGMPPQTRKRLATYCTGADLVMYDAAYAEADYPRYVGWGHSTVTDGAALAKEWGCKHLLFTHFDQRYDDKALDERLALLAEREVESKINFTLARDGLEVVL